MSPVIDYEVNINSLTPGMDGHFTPQNTVYTMVFFLNKQAG